MSQNRLCSNISTYEFIIWRGRLFGLDIGSDAVRAVQLHGRGSVKSLLRYGSIDVPERLTSSNAAADQQKLAATIKAFLAQVGISSKQVVVGLPSSRVFTTTAEFDKLPPRELFKTITYQVDNYIPSGGADSKFDWAVIGDSPKEQRKVEVLLSSVSNAYVESRLDMLESIGLSVIAFEPDSLAIARSLVPANQEEPVLLLDMGSQITDMVLIDSGNPKIIRSINVGTASIVKTVSQSLSIDEKQAEQFVFKFGLAQDKLEGQVYDALKPSVDAMAGEIEKTIKFFAQRYSRAGITKIIVTGGASSLPQLPLYLANRFGVSVEIGNAWRNVSYVPARQNELIAVANHYAVAAGLAERIE